MADRQALDPRNGSDLHGCESVLHDFLSTTCFGTTVMITSTVSTYFCSVEKKRHTASLNVQRRLFQLRFVIAKSLVSSRLQDAVRGRRRGREGDEGEREYHGVRVRYQIWGRYESFVCNRRWHYASVLFALCIVLVLVSDLARNASFGRTVDMPECRVNMLSQRRFFFPSCMYPLIAVP